MEFHKSTQMVDMIYNLLDKKHPLIHSKLEEENQPEDREEFARNMAESMKSWGGIGLSANQVGFPYRMFVMGDGKNYMACYKPKITFESDVIIPIDEGCLTYPGLFVKIYRPDSISVEFEDEKGELHKDDLEGLMCRVFQHEMDHMNGIDFTSRAKKMHLDIAKRKLKRGKLRLKRAHGKDVLAQAS